MKLINLIKADFFINSENYGFFGHDDLDAIWGEIIEPAIKYANLPDKIVNRHIHMDIFEYRREIKDTIADMQ